MTPGVDEVVNDGCAHRVLSYEHDPARGPYGLEAADALGVEPGQVFKTLVV
ncbi:MAG: Cys-tRNA(Pro) deacylase, partial [Actinobacteria bacterium]|nr:Cys-tRNA(Pro) deacylase [Actinomycetota bacterium]